MMMKKCQWCGQYFKLQRKRGNNAVKYCSSFCRREARRETVRESTRKWRREREHTEHMAYLLGESRLDATPCKTFQEEYEAIRKEKRRIGL